MSVPTRGIQTDPKTKTETVTEIEEGPRSPLVINSVTATAYGCEHEEEPSHFPAWQANKNTRMSCTWTYRVELESREQPLQGGMGVQHKMSSIRRQTKKGF